MELDRVSSKSAIGRAAAEQVLAFGDIFAITPLAVAHFSLFFFQNFV
jgi:hypothetical protein